MAAFVWMCLQYNISYVCTMKISGFTIIKNAVKNDYPITEAITSILPVVDEMIVSIGDSEDATEALIRSINSDKIRIVHSVWDPALREGGRILAVETDKAFKHISADSDWAFYIQADEVVHEKYHHAIREAAERYMNDNQVDGLLFHYTHFYGTYDYVGDSRKWYEKEVRIVRNDASIQSYKDAQGFRKNGEKLKVKLIDAWMYHYGWVKDPVQMKQKMYNAGKLWHSDEEMDAFLQSGEFFDFNEFDSVARFEGTHPAVMEDRLRRKNWDLKLDTSKKKFSFKNKLLYWIEKITGKRLFTYANYKIV
ncbi:MAG: glycosyltransferase family 2 protein [Chitinophagaceae bacterium]